MEEENLISGNKVRATVAGERKKLIVASVSFSLVVFGMLIAIIVLAVKKDIYNFSELHGFCSNVTDIQSYEYYERQSLLFQEMIYNKTDAVIMEAGPDLYYYSGLF